jgi:hypothetical protein
MLSRVKRWLAENLCGIQEAGLALLALGLSLVFFQKFLAAAGVLVSVGVLDLVLVWRRYETISSRIHRALPKWVDYGVFIGLTVLAWYANGFEWCSVFLGGVIIGHLFWNEE